MNCRRFDYDIRHNPHACRYVRVWDCRGYPITGVTAAKRVPGGLRIRHHGPSHIRHPDGGLQEFEDFVPGARLTFSDPETHRKRAADNERRMARRLNTLCLAAAAAIAVGGTIIAVFG